MRGGEERSVGGGRPLRGGRACTWKVRVASTMMNRSTTCSRTERWSSSMSRSAFTRRPTNSRTGPAARRCIGTDDRLSAQSGTAGRQPAGRRVTVRRTIDAPRGPSAAASARSVGVAVAPGSCLPTPARYDDPTRATRRPTTTRTPTADPDLGASLASEPPAAAPLLVERLPLGAVAPSMLQTGQTNKQSLSAWFRLSPGGWCVR